MTTSLADILLNNAFLSLTVNNKILCSITKHEMPPKVDIVLGHINGKKFKKTKEWYNYDYSEFEPYIVPDRQNSTKLHCKLTGQTLNKIPDEVKRHTIGKKFMRSVDTVTIQILEISDTLMLRSTS
jgi:Surfeit locus protein 2 (SURF2)